MYRLNLEPIRKRENKTQEQVARAIDISLTNYRNLEKERTTGCQFEVLFKLKKALNCKTIDELFTEIDLEK